MKCFQMFAGLNGAEKLPFINRNEALVRIDKTLNGTN